jgi:hypothetical protein
MVETLERTATPSTKFARAGEGTYFETVDSRRGGVEFGPSYTFNEIVRKRLHPFLSAHDTGPALLLDSWLLRHQATSSVDCPVWFGYLRRTDPQSFVVLVHEFELTTISDIARGLRDRLSLPVLDVAKLCGVKRRQFYNLLNGTSRRTEAEQHMRVLWQAITELDDAVSHDQESLRAALLMPITDDYMSLYDVASDPGRRDELFEVARRLIDRLQSGDISGLLPRPSPGLRALQTDEALKATDEELRRSSSPLDSDGG